MYWYKIWKNQTLFAHISPQALHRDLGPAGPRRIMGVESLPVPQFWQLQIKWYLKVVSTKISTWRGKEEENSKDINS